MTDLIKDRITELKKSNQLADILRITQELEFSTSGYDQVHFGISANITVDAIEATLKKHSILNKKSLTVTMGAFDSHLENIEHFKTQGVQYPIFWNFFDALIPSLESRATLIGNELIQELKMKVLDQTRFMIEASSHFKMTFIPMFHRMSARSELNHSDPISKLVQEFNEVLIQAVGNHSQVSLINTEAIAELIGSGESFLPRFYYKFRAPYGLRFLDEMARGIFLNSRGMSSYYFKVLVLDCDNTLWGGIIGEDQLGGIKVGPYDYPDSIYWTIQNEILSLRKKGVILALCSKNNSQDVDDVLKSHPHMSIRDGDIVLKKVNWNDKPSNIREIATELNVGLDSIVFLDDSEFECNAVRSQLPEVTTIQVPKNIFEYPKIFHQIKELFKMDERGHNEDKTEQYRIRALALQEKAKFSNQTEYLASLGLKVKIRKNHGPSIARISELTQKSNQFNLTTQRYTQQEIEMMMNSSEYSIFSIEVSDKFGDSGLTGIVITRIRSEMLEIENFLMSCRVIGRGVEFAVWPCIFEDAKKKKAKDILASYIKTSKNSLVEDFYDRLGLSLLDATDSIKKYSSAVETISIPQNHHIEVTHEY